MKTRSEVRKLILLVDKDEEEKMAWWSELNQGQRGESGQRQVNRMESDWLNLLRFLLTGGLSGNAVSNTLSASEQIRLIGPIRTTPLPFNDLLQLNCRSRTESKNTRSAPVVSTLLSDQSVRYLLSANQWTATDAIATFFRGAAASTLLATGPPFIWLCWFSQRRNFDISDNFFQQKYNFNENKLKLIQLPTTLSWNSVEIAHSRHQISWKTQRTLNGVHLIRNE